MHRIPYTTILISPFSAVGLSAMNGTFHSFLPFFIWSGLLDTALTCYSSEFTFTEVQRKKKQNNKKQSLCYVQAIFKVYEHLDWFATTLLSLSDIRCTHEKTRKEWYCWQNLDRHKAAFKHRTQCHADDKELQKHLRVDKKMTNELQYRYMEANTSNEK